MIGIFDSGVGGCVSLAELRAINGEVDIVYLADYKNAPYGTKGEGELVPIISENIERLLSLGCERVLIACCTASAMHRLLPEKIREKSVPIIPYAVEEIRRLRARRVTLIATERSVKARAFAEISGFAHLTAISAQPLVGIVERGEWDNPYIDSLILEIKETRPDALVLGCTHFSHLSKRFCSEMPNVKIISPANLGAKAFAEGIGYAGYGITEYI